MRVAFCSNREHHQSEFVQNVKTRLPSVDEFFPINDMGFERNMFELGIQKQRHALSHMIDYDVVVYMNADMQADFLPIVCKPKPNTLYTIGGFSDEPAECWFHFRQQFILSKEFFFCDSKTFDIISLFYKFKQLINGERPIPDKTSFYIYLLNMGIINEHIRYDE